MSRRTPPPFFPAPSNPHRFYADTVYKRIQKLVKEKSAGLKDGELLGLTMLLVDGGRINAESFGYQNPNFLIVYGIDSETGLTVEAWLSHTHVQLLVYVFSQQTDESTVARRTIGFRGPWSAAQD